MADEIQENLGGEGGGKILSRSDLLVIQKQAERYAMTAKDRAEAVQWVMNTGRTAKSLKTRLAAARTLAILDRVNILDEANKIDAAKQPTQVVKVTINKVIVDASNRTPANDRNASGAGGIQLQ